MITEGTYNVLQRLSAITFEIVAGFAGGCY